MDNSSHNLYSKQQDSILPDVDGRPPLFVQRPETSSIDLAAFSFAKPSGNSKRFGLQVPPKCSIVKPISHHHESTTKLHDKAKDVMSGIVNMTLKPPIGSASDIESSVIDNDTAPSNEFPVISTTPELPDYEKKHRSSESQKLNVNSERGLIQRQAISGTKHRSGELNVDLTSTSPLQASELIRPRHPRAESVRQSFVFPQVPHDSKNDMPTSKHARDPENIADRWPHTNPNSKGSSVLPLGEDHLFELLIEKVKQREENEASAKTMRQKLKTQNSFLKAQNQELRCEMDKFHAELQKTALESKGYEAQVEGWKSKIRKFKNSFNELGHAYEVLRDESRKFQEIAVALGKEKGDLTEAIDQIRIQVLRAEEITANQQAKISKDQTDIVFLEHALEMSKSNEKNANSQLSDEKKRIVILESHIQHSAHAQLQQLDFIRNEQSKLMERIGEGLTLVSLESLSSKDMMISHLQVGFDQCRLEVQLLADKCSSEQSAVQSFAVEAHEFASQIVDDLKDIGQKLGASQFPPSRPILETELARKFAENTELQLRLQESTSRVDLGQKESTEMKTMIEELQQLNEEIIAKLQAAHGLSQTLQKENSAFGCKLKITEEKLRQAVDEINISLAQLKDQHETQLRDLRAEQDEKTMELTVQLESLEKENDEKIITLVSQLKAQHKTELDSLEREEEHKNNTVTVELKAHHETQLNTLKKEREEVAVQLKAHQQLKAHHETQLNNFKKEKEECDLALTQLKVQYEAQLSHLKKEKSELKKASEGLIPHLRETQNSLIQAKHTIDQQKKERECFTQEKEEQIQGLRVSYTESMTRLEAQTTEIHRYQTLETTLQMETAHLKEQNEMFQKTICDLEQKLDEGDRSRNDPIQGIVPFAAIQSQLTSQQPTSHYGDPSDFAMLFMSDELFPSTPFNGFNGADDSKSQPVLLEEAMNDIQKQQGTRDTSVESPVTPVEASQPLSKRKCTELIPVNFEGSQQPKKMKKREETDQKPDSPQIPSSEDRTVSHVQKWTYSRIRSTATQVQSTEPVERRTTPQELISASSASHVLSRPGVRARGKRRSRGDRYSARFLQKY